MSERNVKKNFKLSEDFNNYVIEHPEIFKRVPKDACIVMTEKKDSNLTKENIEMAKEIIRKERKSCFKAIKKNRKWMLEAVSI